MRCPLLNTREDTLLSEVWVHCVDLTSFCSSFFRSLYLLGRPKKHALEAQKVLYRFHKRLSLGPILSQQVQLQYAS
jgi:hypothetical protein